MNQLVTKTKKTPFYTNTTDKKAQCRFTHIAMMHNDIGLLITLKSPLLKKDNYQLRLIGRTLHINLSVRKRNNSNQQHTAPVMRHQIIKDQLFLPYRKYKTITQISFTSRTLKVQLT